MGAGAGACEQKNRRVPNGPNLTGASTETGNGWVGGRPSSGILSLDCLFFSAMPCSGERGLPWFGTLG